MRLASTETAATSMIATMNIAVMTAIAPRRSGIVVLARTLRPSASLIARLSRRRGYRDNNLEHRRPENDDEQRRQNHDDHGERHLDGCERNTLLRVLPPLAPQ